MASLLSIFVPRNPSPVLAFAATEVAQGIGVLAGDVPVVPDHHLHGPMLAIGSEAAGLQHPCRPPQGGYSLKRAGEHALIVIGDDERAVLDAVYDVLRELGAEFPLGGLPRLPHGPAIGGVRGLLHAIGEARVRPAFRRRAFVSDIMTWHYDHPERLAAHLAHDREFIPWMARRGLNSFFYIRHAQDTRYRIEEIEPLFLERGIELEYGGHIFQQLLPRESFTANPEYFPLGADGMRNPRGNLCVSSTGALEMLSRQVRDYLQPHPALRRLHPWGADVFEGAWCGCTQCSGIPPQLQYLHAVNAIARAAAPIEVTYLAYHDTLEPVTGMVPEANVWLEWAPRERCYRHAIDDPACHLNPRFFQSLQRYVDAFDGRCHVFEYYADAILFGGLATALTEVIACDLRAYHALGIRSISCLTFGAFSVLAYPLNQIAFAELSRNPMRDPAALGIAAAWERHPGRSEELAQAYREVETASRLVLDYGDVMRPYLGPEESRRKRAELTQAAQALQRAAEIAASAAQRTGDRVASSELALWNYGRVTLEGLCDFIAAREAGSRAQGAAAIERIASALMQMRAIADDLKGTWGAFDLERFHQLWTDRMRRELEHLPATH